MSLETMAFNGIRNHDVALLAKALQFGFSRKHVIHFANPNTPPLSLLSFCANQNFTEGLVLLLQGPYIDTRSALEEACIHRHENCVKVLLVNALRRQRSFSECLFELLDNGLILIANTFVTSPAFNVLDRSMIVSGTNLNSARARWGQTPLHVATLCSSPSTMVLLLGRGVRTDIKDSEGYTPLCVACATGRYICTLRLLQHGADPSYQYSQRFVNEVPRSALFSLCHLSHSSNMNEKLVRMVIIAGADLTKESWLNMPSYRNQTKYVSDITYQRLQTAQRSPSSLFQLCLDHATHGRSIWGRIELLRGKIPEEFRSHFTLSNFEP